MRSRRRITDRQSSLAALIQKRQVSRANVFSALEAKYASFESYEEEIEIEYSTSSSKAKKGKKGKGKKAADEDPLADADFEALQAKMFGGKKQKAKNTHAELDDLDDDAFAALQAKMFGNKKAKK